MMATAWQMPNRQSPGWGKDLWWRADVADRWDGVRAAPPGGSLHRH